MYKPFLSIMIATLLVGCSSSSNTNSDSDVATARTNNSYLAEHEPEGALPVGEAREKANDEESVTLVGLIGGSSEPFVDGIAAFTIVDAKVPHCKTDEGCPTPWDYCCETDAVKENIATIKVVDDAGNPVAEDARKLLAVKELSTVVVEGTAQRDEQGNLTVATNKVYVRPTN